MTASRLRPFMGDSKNWPVISDFWALSYVRVARLRATECPLASASWKKEPTPSAALKPWDDSDKVPSNLGAAQMKVELTRFRIKPDKIGRVDEWLRLLNTCVDECVATLEREKMYVEVVFRERYKNEDFLYWFTIQHESGEPLETSPHEIDKIHRSFGRECIDLTYGAVDPLPQVIMIPEGVAAAMDWTKPHEARAQW